MRQKLKRWTHNRKAKLIRQAIAGKNIFGVLEDHGITWDEFREWWQQYHEHGNVKIVAQRKQRA